MSTPQTIVSKARYAGIKGVARSTVTRWIQNGRISQTKGGLIDVAAADAQLEATQSTEPHHQARSEQVAAEKAAQAAQQGQQHPATPGMHDAGLRLKEARIRYEENRADMQALQRDELAGQLIRKADAEFVLDDVLSRMANLLERMADQLTPVIVSHKGDAHAIHGTLFEGGLDMRRELAGYLSSKGLEVSGE